MSETDSSAGRTIVRLALAYFALFAIYGVASPYLQILLRGLGYGPAAIGALMGLFEIMGIAVPVFAARAADARGANRPALVGSALLVLASLPFLSSREGPLSGLAAVVAGLSLMAVGLKTMIPVMDAATVGALAAIARDANFTSVANDARFTSVAGVAGAARLRRAFSDYGALRAIGSAGYVAMAVAVPASPGVAAGSPASIAAWIGASAAAFALAALLAPAGRTGARAAAATRVGDGSYLDKAFLVGILAVALGRLSMASVSSFLSLYAVESVGWNAVGAMWAAAALSEIPLMIVSGRIIARTGPMGAIGIGSAAIVVRLAIYALFPSPAGLIAGQLLHSLCFGLAHPAGIAFVAERVPPGRRATGMAIYMGLGMGLPSVLGSALGGLVVEAWGYRVLFGAFSVFAMAALALYAAARRGLFLRQDPLGH